MSRLLPLAASLALTAGLLAGAMNGPATAAKHTHYKESARSVAGEIGCKQFRRTGGGQLHLDAGDCWIKGKRVSVITFRGTTQQRKWNSSAKWMLPSNHYWANGKGAVVTARNGNRTAAALGAKRLPGKVVHAF